MSLTQELSHRCPPPFILESSFPNSGGYIEGRMCASMPSIANGQKCCLPCPTTDWLYPSNFYSLTRIAGIVNVVALALSVFMLLSFAVLPAEKTRRHYLNVCLVIAVMSLELGFIIPWARRPARCHNAITPNDMYSSMTCAWGGAFVVFGGVSVNTWILIRAFSMHLQICWDIIPGRFFFWFAQLFGWLLAFVLLSTELSLSGVSFRFGDYCHVNHTNSLATLWGPLLGFAGVSLVLQLSTFIYCLNVYLKHSFGNLKTDTQSSRQQTSLMSTRSANARRVFRRVKKVVSLQWRGLAIAVLVVTDVIFFSVVFVVLDNETQRAVNHPQSFTPWLTCMVLKQDREACLSLAEGLLVNESILIATLLLLAVVGIEAFILICRFEMITGWIDLVTSRWHKQSEQREFVSLDARRFSADPRTHELLTINSHVESQSEPSKTAQTSESQAKSPVTEIEPPRSPMKLDERLYRSPHGSFSSPRPPSARSPSTPTDHPPLSPRFGQGLRPMPEEEKT